MKVYTSATARFSGKIKLLTNALSEFNPQNLSPPTKNLVVVSDEGSLSNPKIYHLDLEVCTSKKIGWSQVGFGWDHYKTDVSKKAEAVVTFFIAVYCDE